MEIELNCGILKKIRYIPEIRIFSAYLTWNKKRIFVRFCCIDHDISLFEWYDIPTKKERDTIKKELSEYFTSIEEHYISRTRKFKASGIDYDLIVEATETKDEIWRHLREYIHTMKYHCFDVSEDVFKILYDDGSKDVIDIGYDFHKIRRRGIVSIVYDNDFTTMVYGNFFINERGEVIPSEETMIDQNVLEITGRAA